MYPTIGGNVATMDVQMTLWEVDTPDVPEPTPAPDDPDPDDEPAPEGL